MDRSHETCVIIVGVRSDCEPRKANTAPQLENFNYINMDHLPKVQTGSGVCTVSYSVGTGGMGGGGGCYYGGKTDLCEECVELYFHSALYLGGVRRGTLPFISLYECEQFRIF